MATPVLVATPGPTANTYATRAEATAYFDTQLYRENWETSYGDQQDRALLTATRLLDEHINWNGVKISELNALRWPQDGHIGPDGYIVNSTTIPQFLKNATSELAGHLIGSNRTADSDTKGFSRMKAGDLELVINQNDRASVIPDSVLAMISFYGTLTDKGQVKVYRV